MIDLYYWPTPNGHKVTMFLEEAGLEYDIHPVDISAGDQFKPEFLAFSPNNRMPAIIDTQPADDGEPVTVFESGAILLYLAEKTGRFMPTGLRGRKTVLEWLFWQVGGLGPMAGQNHHFGIYAPEKLPYAITRYVNETNRLYGVLDRRLATHEYLGGEAYSIADMATYPWVVPWKRQQQNLDEFPHRAVACAGPLLALAGASLSPSIHAQPAQAAATAQAAARLPVQQFLVEGNSLLPEPQLQATLAPFKGERSLAELKQAAAAVQELYREAGYGAVIAYLPEQRGAAGTVTIQVLEGKVARVVVLGNQQFSEANIRRSLPLLVEGQTPQVQRLDAQIQLANENPAKQLAVVLEPGQQQGEVDARITVTERPAGNWLANADNTGNRQTGHLRLGLAYQNSGLWDRDHQLMLQAQTSPEHADRVKVFSGSYRVPFYGQGLVLDAYGAYSNVDGGSTSTAAGALQFNGRGRVLGTRLSKLLPRRGETDQRVTIGLDHRAYLNDCAIAGLPDGACGSAGESVSVAPLSLEYQVQQGGAWPAGATVALVRNLGLGGHKASQQSFDAVRPGAQRDYTIARLGGFLNIPLPQDWRLQARVNGQLSSTALVPGEQYGLGGANAVRGYEEREINGDRGASGSIELLGPDLSKSISESIESLRLLAFFDAGKVWNRGEMPCLGNRGACSLASLGLGLRLAAGPLQLRLDLAQALRPGARTERHDLGLHFQAVYSFN